MELAKKTELIQLLSKCYVHPLAHAEAVDGFIRQNQEVGIESLECMMRFRWVVNSNAYASNCDIPTISEEEYRTLDSALDEMILAGEIGLFEIFSEPEYTLFFELEFIEQSFEAVGLGIKSRAVYLNKIFSNPEAVLQQSASDREPGFMIQVFDSVQKVLEKHDALPNGEASKEKTGEKDQATSSPQSIQLSPERPKALSAAAGRR